MTKFRVLLLYTIFYTIYIVYYTIYNLISLLNDIIIKSLHGAFCIKEAATAYKAVI